MVVVLLLAAVSGVRSWISPNRAPETVVSGQSGFPSDEARAVATRYAVSYLSWDEGNPDERPAQIGLDLAAGLDSRAGWNGRGKQTADIAYPGQVKPDSNGVTAVVDVRVKVHSFVKRGSGWAAGPVSWERLSVPVAQTASRV
ncbi:MAG TPA: conjugal transfer protein, partial [Kribbella sp.]|nr:conjugal transfer protein [Kribbella sp.]